MELDTSAAREFLAVLDGEKSIEAVWEHPAYDVARDHAKLFGRDLTIEDVKGALAGEDTAFAWGGKLADHRDQIESLLEHVERNEDEWGEEMERELQRVTPERAYSKPTVYFAIGYEMGIGLDGGAFVNLNVPFFFGDPRQLFYTALHESSHVCYERYHDARSEFGPDDFTTQAGQRDIFRTVFHTEAFATYTPLRVRRTDGNLAEDEHIIAQDYRILDDAAEKQSLVAEYDAFREELADGAVSRERFMAALFGELRLPYRVGCVLLDELAAAEGLDAVREAFVCEPTPFVDHYDWVLDGYRTA